MTMCVGVYLNIQALTLIHFIASARDVKSQVKFILQLFDKETFQFSELIKKKMNMIFNNMTNSHIKNIISDNWNKFYLTYCINSEKYINALLSINSKLREEDLDKLRLYLKFSKVKIDNLLNDKNSKLYNYKHVLKLSKNDLDTYFTYMKNDEQIIKGSGSATNFKEIDELIHFKDDDLFE